MSSFLADVLITANQTEIEDLNDKIVEITKTSYALKCEVKKVIDDKFVNFTKPPDESNMLIVKAKSLSSEVKMLLERVETQTKRGLQNSTSELKSLSASLQEVTLTLNEVNQIVKLDNALDAAHQAQENGEYLETVKKLQQIQALLDSFSDKEVAIYGSLKEENSYIHEKFLFDMLECWRLCLKWEEMEAEKGRKRICLKVDFSRLNEIEHMFQALNYLKRLDYELSKFGNKVLKYVLSPLIVQDGSVETLSFEKVAVLEVETIDASSKPNYRTVLMNLKKVFQFFQTFLSLLTDENITFLNKLSERISDEFCQCLIKSCLSDTIPSNSDDLQSFEVVATDVEEFHKYLKEIGFLDQSNQSILDYAKNVDVLFANKICQVHLNNAREIMKRDLHDMMEVGPTLPNLSLLEIEVSSTFTTLEPDVKLSDDTFQFPKCQISKSTHELLLMVHSLLEEAVRFTELYSARLFCTARNIMELYRAVVPTYHSKFLETIPQQVALFHNNCMYLAHHLTTLGLPGMQYSHTVTFIDQVPKLRNLGTSTFLKFMQSQRKLILDILRDSGLATLGEDSKLSLSTEKAIRQCLRQLEILQTVWQTVLPVNVYCKAMGCLLNAFVDELIIRIVTIEDIPAHVASTLVIVFGVVSDRAPQIFQDPREVNRYVKKWQKFQELVLILGASLSDINDRWAERTGPLAHEFTADEVKQLIRALFQNNKRRSAILALIK